jgi:hypothetical protein
VYITFMYVTFGGNLKVFFIELVKVIEFSPNLIIKTSSSSIKLSVERLK